MNNRGLKLLINLDLFIAGFALIVLVIITFTGVFMRYWFKNPYVWQEEMQIFCFLWVVFFGTSAAFRTGSHVAIDIVVDMLPQTVRKTIAVICYFVVVGILLFVMRQGITLVLQLARSDRLTNILKIPYKLIYASLPVGCALMIINFSAMTWRDINGI